MSSFLTEPMSALSPWLAIPIALLLVLGGLITFIGALGLLRLPNFYQRIHGPAVFITVGTGCFLISSMLYFSGTEERPVVHELLITAFVLLTAPVVSMMVMRAGVYRDLRARKPDSGKIDAYQFPDDE
ncbi:monovalent cation/H(+) antiporter subunit G [Halopseudomonas xiamenensis]|uniref:monovalent cation/H(+) antiporter subunit G n=1 Tax=Halopseudomonas xiamenensis TaxID=157792 RepID=UPI001F3C56F2|nr:monovalent cation/H(+) antiporter subunit G [Halopseudomonas xiamenensis]